MNFKRENFAAVVMVALLFVLLSCRTGTVHSTPIQAVTPKNLELPQVPMLITDPQSRAAYITNHFWDSMDFSDTLRSHNRDFIEQNFVNFISFFSAADAESRLSAVQRLMKAAEVDAEAHTLLRSVAEKYLYDPSSPIVNDDYYVLFLRSFHDCNLLSDADVKKYSAQLFIASKNLPGTIVADTRILMRGGKVTTLHETIATAPLSILAFYDPECSNCLEILDNLKADTFISRLVQEGQLMVIALYAEGKADIWQKSCADLPKEWRVAMDIGGCLENKSFVVRASPTFYLIDKEARVLMKDAMLADMVNRLALGTKLR